VAIVRHERLQPEQQGHVAQREELQRRAEIAPHQPLHRHVVMAVALFHVAQKSLEAARLDGLQLLAHGVEVGGEGELAAVVEDQAIGGIDPPQIQHLAQGYAQRGEFRLVEQRHDQQGGPGLEGVPLAREVAAAAARLAIFLNDRDADAALRQVCGRRDAADPSADHNGCR